MNDSSSVIMLAVNGVCFVAWICVIIPVIKAHRHQEMQTGYSNNQDACEKQGASVCNGFCGECKDTDYGYSCSCKFGWSGENCEISPCENDFQVCENGGECVFEGFNPCVATCKCKPGYAGPTCGDTTHTMCDNFHLHQLCAPCGSCMEEAGISRLHCKCHFGWSGLLCKLDPCENGKMKCRNGGTCVADYDTCRTKCVCPPNFTGRNCQSTTGNVCSNPGPSQCNEICGECQATKDGFTCSCRFGWSGEHCEISPCENEHLQCQNGGSCVFDGFNRCVARCKCPPNFTGENCEKRPCRNGNVRCKNGGSCVFDGFNPCVARCKCRPNFTGEKCEKNTACSNPGPSQCNENCGVCRPTNAGFRCKCKFGWTGKRCQISPCTNGKVRCKNGGSCVLDGFNPCVARCKCQPNFTGENCESGTTCNNPGPSQCNEICGECQVTKDGPRCNCKFGWSGKRCQISPCVNGNEKCLNGGTCIIRGFNPCIASCKCPPGYTGSQCEDPDAVCSNPGPSQCNELCGDCQVTKDGPRCNCKFGWSGDRCEISPCINGNFECQNGGICIFHGDNPCLARCHCLPGFTGEKCEDTGASCDPGPPCKCGSCVDLIGGAKCKCLDGWTGSECDQGGPCTANPCKNGGTCLQDNANCTYECQCAHPFTGPDCKNTITY